ncbi:MAG TPA: 50S ribosomal protein L17, partial [Chthoniobacterales bacterium]|nr:50S ribosomal protein L17 [Chthoniobacterales bacterium]
MRHQKKTVKLGRTAEHRKALLANQVCSLIEHERIKTTLAKAKAVRPLAERMVTLGKNGSLHARRTAMAVLRQKNAVKKLFDNIAPRSSERMGGYTRIVKLGPRRSDSAPIAFLEWVDAAPATEEKEKEPKKKQAKEKAPKPEQAEKEGPAGAKQSATPASEAKAEPKSETKAAAEEKSTTPAEEP